jgi:1-acyl-sn-glycerol-3-phosphate acyltransferase
MPTLETLRRSVRDAIPVDPRVAAAIDSVPNVLSPLGYDPWGFSPDAAKLYFSLAALVYRYFRPVVRGIEHIPEGRCLIVANHSGQLPFDGLVVAVACLLEASPPRLCRAMAERWFPTLPFVNEAFSRSGVVVGDPINCRNLLEAGNAILVFPEGARGSGKTWDHRYRLVRFGRGFMRLALQTGAPIVPVSVIGGEESIISLKNLRPLARVLRTPYFPLPALFPVLGPLSFLPLPVRFHVTFGEPLRFDGPFDDEDEVIEAKVQQVMDRVQAMIDEGLAARTSIF